MPSRTGKKEEPAPLPTTTTKTIQYEEVEGEEELYYYNRQYIEAFFQEYVTSFSSAATIPQDAKEEVSVKFSERHLLSQDISVASKLNQDLVNLTPHVVNIVGAQFHEK